MRRKSVARRNPDSETSILSPLIEFLEILSNQGKLRYFRAHPVRLVSKNGKTFPAKIRPSQRGAPDIFIRLPGTDCWVEGKSAKGKASESQQIWRQFAEDANIPYFQPRSHGDVHVVINWIRDRIQ